MLSCLALCHAVNPIVICTNLNESLAQLLSLEISAHVFPQALSENFCMTLDPCTGIASTGESVPENTWVWANTTAMRFDRPVREKNSNLFNLQYARVPAGIRLHACSPNFDSLRNDIFKCNEDTVVEVVGRCPSESAYSLLDCIQSIEHNSILHELPFRSQNEIMHFGSRTYNDACLHGTNDAVGTALCNFVSSNYNIRLNYAAAAGSTQMIRWEFEAGAACNTEAQPGFYLSNAEPPNVVLPCNPVLNAVFVGPECAFQCDVGYMQVNGACKFGCENLTQQSCASGFFAEHQCVANGATFYDCKSCDAVPGEEFLPWTSANPGVCSTRPCPAGQFEDAGTCHTCAENFVSATPGSTQCVQCNTELAGVYSPGTGGTSCEACFATASVAACLPGQQAYQDFDKIQAFFNATNSSEHKKMLAYCIAGVACLPCPPGTREIDSVCVACPHATYQPNWRMTTCFACADSHNTSRVGATAAEECQCRPGFDKQ